MIIPGWDRKGALLAGKHRTCSISFLRNKYTYIFFKKTRLDVLHLHVTQNFISLCVAARPLVTKTVPRITLSYVKYIWTTPCQVPLDVISFLFISAAADEHTRGPTDATLSGST